MITCRQLLDRLTEALRAAGVDSPRLDARLLLAHLLGVESSWLFSHPDHLLDAEQEAAALALGERRCRREPVSRILGRREFWSLSFRIGPETLDPRPDTETIVEAALGVIADRQATLSILDLGTGSGCLLLALLSELPQAEGLGIDISGEALAVAADNAGRLSLNHRARFARGDWGRGIDGLFDVILANPPYIRDQDIDGLDPEVTVFEPRAALAGGADGLDCYRALAADAARLIRPGGAVVVEVGQGQAEAVAAILGAQGLSLVEIRRDLGGIERCVVMSRAAEPEK
ncbi:MAG TPA: peptide chain release factor N(5)-glutamine methyltransferase [Rhodospirillaceae bacterium]|nr:peptide chain release factor N(5)-glutamine methyltransferase [Rhodospirillaceae bacterium]